MKPEVQEREVVLRNAKQVGDGDRRVPLVSRCDGCRRPLKQQAWKGGTGRGRGNDRDRRVDEVADSLEDARRARDAPEIAAARVPSP